MASNVTIYQAGGYSLVSHGNGWAYTMTRPDGATLWLQDDDATTFRDELDSLPATWPVKQTLAYMAELYEAAFNHEGYVT